MPDAMSDSNLFTRPSSHAAAAACKMQEHLRLLQSSTAYRRFEHLVLGLDLALP